MQPLGDGRSVYVEEPYTEERYRALIAGQKLLGLRWPADPNHPLSTPVIERESQPTEPPKTDDILPGGRLGPVEVPKGL